MQETLNAENMYFESFKIRFVADQTKTMACQSNGNETVRFRVGGGVGGGFGGVSNHMVKAFDDKKLFSFCF